jgi:hypothetical protein
MIARMAPRANEGDDTKLEDSWTSDGTTCHPRNARRKGRQHRQHAERRGVVEPGPHPPFAQDACAGGITPLRNAPADHVRPSSRDSGAGSAPPTRACPTVRSTRGASPPATKVAEAPMTNCRSMASAMRIAGRLGLPGIRYKSAARAHIKGESPRSADQLLKIDHVHYSAALGRGAAR